ncbi:GntR family transcriptional regulator [Photobacterium sp. BZF1]|uniref:GntR family transcriptional regulator n=1 Tax=Photobacterium sp. BZF1 TaxID=1904457 RepID=UPI001CA3E33A|nr:GntR family transcriptional regulator [Photobacterium sp. BZF1]
MTNYIAQKQSLPLYVQIADFIKQEIERGNFKPGSILPSEKQLVEDFNVSRVTVRKAIQLLNEEGLTYSEKGKGTFIAQQKLKHSFVNVVGLTEESQLGGQKVSNKVIDFAVIDAPAAVAQKLQVAENSPVYCCSRQRLLDNRVASFETFYIPVSYLPEMTEQDMAGSKFAYLEAKGYSIGQITQKLKPALPEKRIQGYFDIDPLTPILINESLSYLKDGQIFELSKVYFKTSEYDFELVAYNE